MFCKSSLFRFQVILAASAVALMAVPVFGQSSGVLNGRVTDGQGGGIAGVKVTVTSQIPPRMVLDTETSDNGNYRIMGLRANDYEVVAEKEGMGSAAAVFTIREGQNLSVDLNIGAAAAAVTGRSGSAAIAATTAVAIGAAVAPEATPTGTAWPAIISASVPGAVAAPVIVIVPDAATPAPLSSSATAQHSVKLSAALSARAMPASIDPRPNAFNAW